jgi:hypothetical protein
MDDLDVTERRPHTKGRDTLSGVDEGARDGPTDGANSDDGDLGCGHRTPLPGKGVRR